MKRLRIKQEQKKRRKLRVRRKIVGTAERPRISVYKSNKYLYVQVIDDSSGQTLAQSSGVSGDTKGLKATVEGGKQIGEDLGGKMKALGLERAVYDRNGNRYHGVLKAVADGVRNAGIQV